MATTMLTSTAAPPSDAAMAILRCDAGFHRWSRAHGAVESVYPGVEISPPDVVRRRAMAAHGIVVESVQCMSEAVVKHRFRAPMHLLVAYEHGNRRDEIFVGGLAKSTPSDFARKLTFVPAGQDYEAWHHSRAKSHFTYVSFDPAKSGIGVDPGIAERLPAPRPFFEDEALWHTILKLKRLIELPGPTDELYFDALGNVLVCELTRLDRMTPAIEAQVRGGLAAWQQRVVSSYIDEHLVERIPLATLARLARLSPHHFCRSFRRSFGTPPHRYQIRRRIERSKSLLEKPAASITEIAFAMGFSNLSAFTTAFHKTMGLTPTAYRRGLASDMCSSVMCSSDMGS